MPRLIKQRSSSFGGGSLQRRTERSNRPKGGYSSAGNQGLRNREARGENWQLRGAGGVSRAASVSKLQAESVEFSSYQIEEESLPHLKTV